MKQFRILLIVFLFSLSSCASGQTVDVNTFEKGLTNDVQLLDVRTPEEYQEEHLVNAKLANINDDKTFEKVTATLDKEKPVYVYCHSGRRSEKAAGVLQKKGFKQVVNLDGGIEAWKEAGKPLE